MRGQKKEIFSMSFFFLQLARLLRCRVSLLKKGSDPSPVGGQTPFSAGSEEEEVVRMLSPQRS